MKKILITGANSYIGTSFEKWLEQYSDKYSVDTVDMIGCDWKKKSFVGYDVVFHVAAIVHVKENNTDKYNFINRDLTLAVAEKSKADGVEHFIFLSTMGVYGTEIGYITSDNLPVPKTYYAKSKYEAEHYLFRMNTSNFCVAVLRPPLVYGKDCKGNYPKLAKMALKLPVFPNVKNERSMIYIDNLSEFIRLLIDDCMGGLYSPQNRDYVNITELVKLIVQAHGKKIRLTKMFNWSIPIGLKLFVSFRKIFGSFVYDKSMSGGPEYLMSGKRVDYETASFEESIKRTERGEKM